MPDTPIVVGVDALWGVGNLYTGIITQVRATKNGEEAFLYDGNGFTITQIFFDLYDEYEVELVFQTGTTWPDIGDLVTIDSVPDMIVQPGGEKMWEQRGWTKLKFRARKYPNVDTGS